MLKIKYRIPLDLIVCPGNARTHTDKQIDQIRQSIQEFGFTNPILIDEKDELIAGEGRLKAAKLEELEKVPTITLEGLSDVQKKAYRLADNAIPLNAGWNQEVLTHSLKELKDLKYDTSIIGFSDKKLKEFMGDVPENKVQFTVGHNIKIKCKDEAECAEIMDLLGIEKTTTGKALVEALKDRLK